MRSPGKQRFRQKLGITTALALGKRIGNCGGELGTALRERRQPCRTVRLGQVERLIEVLAEWAPLFRRHCRQLDPLEGRGPMPPVLTRIGFAGWIRTLPGALSRWRCAVFMEVAR